MQKFILAKVTRKGLSEEMTYKLRSERLGNASHSKILEKIFQAEKTLNKDVEPMMTLECSWERRQPSDARGL